MRDPATIGEYTYDRAEWPNASRPGPWHITGKMGDIWEYRGPDGWHCVSDAKKHEEATWRAKPVRPTPLYAYCDWPTHAYRRVLDEMRRVEAGWAVREAALAAEGATNG
jgi:hypothetical protein